MNLETFFSESDIDEIYNTTIIYSILKYQSLPEVFKKTFQKRYENAIQFMKDRHISPDILKNCNLETLKQQLTEYQTIYNSNIQLNKETIEQTSSNITRLITHTISQVPNEIDRISYLFDFITNYLKYSEDYNNYCLTVPPIDSFLFDFKNTIPIEPSINGVLVMGQGICDDISNVLQFLGQLLNLQITKITCNYKESLHSLNAITLSNGNTYLIDATRLIRKDKKKEECFLVSASDLNKDNYYEFKENLSLTTTYKNPIPDYSKQAFELLTSIAEIKPQIEDLNTHTKTTLK